MVSTPSVGDVVDALAAALRVGEGEQQRIHQIAHVHQAQPAGGHQLRAQAGVYQLKVGEDVAVARAVHPRRAQYGNRQPRIAQPHALGGQFAASVRGHRRRRIVLMAGAAPRRGSHRRLAADQDELPWGRVGARRRRAQRRGAAAVHLMQRARRPGTGQAGQVHHGIGAAQQTVQGGAVGQMLRQHRLGGGRQRGAVAGGTQQAAHRVAARGQRRHQVGADEPGAAGNRYPHRRTADVALPAALTLPSIARRDQRCALSAQTTPGLPHPVRAGRGRPPSTRMPAPR